MNQMLIAVPVAKPDCMAATELITEYLDRVFGWWCFLTRLSEGVVNYGAFSREIYQFGDVAMTINMYHIKHHYYVSHTTINPSGVVPVGPDLDLHVPHGRNFKTQRDNV